MCVLLIFHVIKSLCFDQAYISKVENKQSILSKILAHISIYYFNSLCFLRPNYVFKFYVISWAIVDQAYIYIYIEVKFKKINVLS